MNLYILKTKYTNIYQEEGGVYNFTVLSDNKEDAIKKLEAEIKKYEAEGFVRRDIPGVLDKHNETIIIEIIGAQEGTTFLYDVNNARQTVNTYDLLNEELPILKNENPELYSILYKQLKTKGHKGLLSLIEELADDGFEYSIFEIYGENINPNDIAKEKNMSLSEFILMLNKDVRKLNDKIHS